MQELKCSIVVENKEQLRLAIQEIEERKQLYKSNVKRMSEYSNKFKGLSQAVDVIEDVANI